MRMTTHGSVLRGSLPLPCSNSRAGAHTHCGEYVIREYALTLTMHCCYGREYTRGGLDVSTLSIWGLDVAGHERRKAVNLYIQISTSFDSVVGNDDFTRTNITGNPVG